LVYLLHGLGIGTGVDLDRLAQAGEFICEQLGKPTRSRTAQAWSAKRLAASLR
jgi:hydroxymethylglutaryl-CoA lyase